MSLLCQLKCPNCRCPIYTINSFLIYSSLNKMETTWTNSWNMDNSTLMPFLYGLDLLSVSLTFTIQNMWKLYWDQQVSKVIFCTLNKTKNYDISKSNSNNPSFDSHRAKRWSCVSFSSRLDRWDYVFCPLHEIFAKLLYSFVSFIDALFITLSRKRVIGDRGSEVVSTQTTLDPRVPLWCFKTLYKINGRFY